MRLISVNIGKTQTYAWRDGTQNTLHKSPVTDEMSIHKSGLSGDEQVDQKNHGGEYYTLKG